MTTKTMTKATKVSAPAIESGRTRNHPAWRAGDVAHQGDLIFIGLAEMPAGKARKNRQLADGNTRGSRHIVEGGEVFDVAPALVRKAIAAFKVDVTSDLYVGPVFRGPCEVTHPKHAHHTFPDGSIVAVVYQRNVQADGREARAAD